LASERHCKNVIRVFRFVVGVTMTYKSAITLY